jgi:hypothetical protein
MKIMLKIQTKMNIFAFKNIAIMPINKNLNNYKMKKILILIVALAAISLMSSCRSTRPSCPAYGSIAASVINF